MRFWNGISFLLLQSARAFTNQRAIRQCVLRTGIGNPTRESWPGTLMPRSNMFCSKYTAEERTKTEQQSTNSFQSPTFRVYIEDTDAYGVMYNSNYVRAYERALLQYASLASHTGDASISLNRKWILSSIHNQKFRSSPALGEEYVIRGNLIESDYDGQFSETWELELVTEKESGAFVHNSAVVTVTTASSHPKIRSTAITNAITLPENGKVYERRYTPYHDEFDHRHDSNSSGHSYFIPLRNAMNFFERSRSDFLGGPQSLRKLQVEDDLIWVVTGVDNGKLLLCENIVSEKRHMDVMPVDEYSPEDEMNSILTVEPKMIDSSTGNEVVVRTAFEVKRRGMIIDCHHALLLNEGGNGTKLLAQATCTILALKGSTRRPTSNLPPWLLDKFAQVP